MAVTAQIMIKHSGRYYKYAETEPQTKQAKRLFEI